MLSDKSRKCFSDIIRAIDLIDEWVRQAPGVEAALVIDSQSRSAIERQLPIISEAAIRLHKLDPALAPALAAKVDWPGVRGIGNFIRHRYDHIDSSVFAEVLGSRLAELKAACVEALTK